MNAFLPCPMHTWHWQSVEGQSYLTCSLLEPWPHGFFTRHVWPRSPQELTSVLNPAAQTYRVKQVHGNTVFSASEVGVSTSEVGDNTPEYQEADALVTDAPNQSIWVCSADCTPVLIANTATNQVAAIHSGWRGTAAKVVPLTIARLLADGGTLSSLRVALGPAITGDVYQVAVDVALEVGATITTAIGSSDPEDWLDALFQIPQSPILPDPEPGRVRLDVRRMITLQLEQLGLAPEQVATSPHCTYQQPEHFFSYRRDGQKKVQWSGIVSL